MEVRASGATMIRKKISATSSLTDSRILVRALIEMS
jgi:hypothetical protein